MGIWKFLGLFFLYSLVSTILHFGAAFTIAAGIIYLFFLLPFYGVCLLSIISWGLTGANQQKVTVKFRIPLLIPVGQVLTVLSSPASCVGFKQGDACYSFIQTLVMGMDTEPAHWGIVESIFLPAFFLYLAFLGGFLGTVRIEKTHRTIL